jgi:hypothetical protein
MGEGVGRGELSAASGFRWDWVNHSKGGFSRPQANGNPGPVSTNGVEGLFGRLKQHLRPRGVTKISKRCAKYLGEFLQRKKYLIRRNLGTYNWRPYAFFLLCRAVADHYVKPADVITDILLAYFYVDLERKWCPPVASGGSGPGSVFRQRMLHSSAVLIDLDSESDFEVVSNVAVPRVCDAVPGLSTAATAAMSSGKNFSETSSSDESDEEYAQMMGYYLNVGAEQNNSNVLHVHLFLPVHVNVHVSVHVRVDVCLRTAPFRIKMHHYQPHYLGQIYPGRLGRQKAICIIKTCIIIWLNFAPQLFQTNLD